jgi:hypothetical protein
VVLRGVCGGGGWPTVVGRRWAAAGGGGQATVADRMGAVRVKP